MICQKLAPFRRGVSFARSPLGCELPPDMTVCLATKVLVIEDDPDVLETLGRVLEREGYIPILATSGRSGIAAFRMQAPALVITDLFMPEGEGIETILEMRRLYPDAKIIAISGGGSLGNMQYLEMAAKLGATAVIPKPFEPERLVDAVGRVLALAG